MQQPDIIVIGAGPAGLMAAGRAAEAGAIVWLLEKMEKPARKLRITGKGRCNITNTNPWSEFEHHIFPVARAFRPAFMNFPNTALVSFMEQIGVPVVEERGNRVFPASSKAQEVADALVRWVQRQGVVVCCHTEVRHFIESNGSITAVETLQRGARRTMQAKAFIVATGGLSYPLTGSTGDGFRLAGATGHAVTALRPSLVSLKTEGLPPALDGLALRNVSLQLVVDGHTADEEFGEMAFTGDGVEGPVVLRLSNQAVDALLQNRKVELALNCKPALTPAQIRVRLQREIAETGNQPLSTLLRKWLPASLIAAFVRAAGVPPKKAVSQLTAHDIAQIAETMQCWRIRVTGYGGYERAVVTAGGVSMKDIDIKTMRSRKAGNLFFAGEVLDLHADTGGYNLQVAFSTGYLAGLSAAKQLFD